MEQPVANIEEAAIKNWERRKSIEEKNQEEQRFERRIRGEKQIEMRQELQKSSRIRGEDNNKDAKCKLPKLVISQFNSIHIDYFRFWNQFGKQIEKSELTSVTKLSYLKEMVIPKVRRLIDGLPRNTEGYERTNIFSSKFGKARELANAHIQNILSLPVIAGTNPVRINEFYEN